MIIENMYFNDAYDLDKETVDKLLKALPPLDDPDNIVMINGEKYIYSFRKFIHPDDGKKYWKLSTMIVKGSWQN